MMVDSLSLPIHFEITGGQVHDSRIAPQPVGLDEVEFVIGNKAGIAAGQHVCSYGCHYEMSTAAAS
jgi:hypothetical protein